MASWLAMLFLCATGAFGNSSEETKKFFDLLAKEVYLPSSALLVPPAAVKKEKVDATAPPPVDAAERIRRAQDLLDDYFKDLISGYPAPTQTFLRETYFGGIGLKEKKGLMEKEGNFAAATITIDGEKVSYQVLVDPAVPRAPLWFRQKLIHEIAVHLGQAHQRVAQVGALRFATEQNSGAFELFSELTAALVEKRVIDALPLDAGIADIKLNIKDERMREAFLKEYKFRREADFQNYAWLRQRIAYAAKSFSAYDIKAFVNLYETKESKRARPQ